MLLEPNPDAASSVDVGWMPEVIVLPRPRVGTGFWIAGGLCVLVASWVGLSIISFVTGMLQQSTSLGLAAMVLVAGGCAMLAYAVVLEIRAYRSLGTAERLRGVLAAGSTTVAVARAQALAWVGNLKAGVLDRSAVERMLSGATSVAEVRSVLRSQVADHLREMAGALGRRAAVEGATMVAICPHPAWDGLIAGWRGLLVIRQVAVLYGLRPGFVATLALVRRVAWSAAGTTMVSLVSLGLADQVLSDVPVVKHVVGALPGSGAVAVRLYRLAGVTAEACSPVP